MISATGKLVRAELRLMTRDPLVLTFVFVFPVVTMLIIGGSFGTAPDPAFAHTNPAHWYVASYLTVVIAATGLVMLPVHLASYRERGDPRAPRRRRSSPAGYALVGGGTPTGTCADHVRRRRGAGRDAARRGCGFRAQGRACRGPAPRRARRRRRRLLARPGRSPAGCWPPTAHPGPRRRVRMPRWRA